MAIYIMKRQTIKLKVNKLKPTPVYTLKPNIKNAQMVKIKSLNIASPKCADILIAKKLDKDFRKIMAIYLQAIDSDDSGNIAIALNEITRLKEIIMLKYQENMSKELLSKYLKRLALFEKNLQEKQRILTYAAEIFWNKPKSR